MGNFIERFYTFLLNKKTKAFCAFILYIFILFGADLPSGLRNFVFIVIAFSITFLFPVYVSDWLLSTRHEKLLEKLKKIFKELLMFIPVLAISLVITYLFKGNQSVNQLSLEESFNKYPIIFSIITIIIGPIVEEFIFRLLPHCFIKNQIFYIVFSSVVFAAMHVVDDPHAFYYIWFYMMRPLYYAYRYYETRDLLVPISLHSLNNLIALFFLIFKY